MSTSTQAVDMAELVETLIAPLVEYKDELEIMSSESEDGTVLIEIRVNEADAGKVIGRQGRVIKAVRTVVRAAGSRFDTNVDVELID